MSPNEANVARVSEILDRRFPEALEKVPNLALPQDRVLLCCLYDVKANEVAGGVFVARTPAEAIRMFADGVNQPGEAKSLVQLHPEDFRLVQLGWLDRRSCQLEGLYRALIDGSEVKQ